ncbi:5-formyltetrahydrofolate cyclo-ligase [Ascoidea rubescens DSM 1968]|uniref:5-formyltetrahydrofolate cyclo-ligase n=1 Tax=Ascoidea rubescens DSM 1968 TaxID=1344418 RepID=A0A1D2VK14_9ASCO|nr:nagb/rpia/CoA transferase-like protein [Ascoidea rubescens DSM 1968]ODV61940.1 nagb/rpia/CoA transferase-like protein [Ascoidea rubescens DSM 1968]
MSKQLKVFLRKELNFRLSSVSQRSLDAQASNVYSILKDLPVYQRAKSVAIYMSMPSKEVPTLSIIKHLFGDDKFVFLPKCFINLNEINESASDKYITEKSLLNNYYEKYYLPVDFDQDCKPERNTMMFFQMNSFDDVLDLKPSGKYKLKEPSGINQKEIFDSQIGLDLIIMPAMGYEITNKNTQIKRLGHGAGFYDSFVHKLHRQSKLKATYLLGIGLKEQLIENIPYEKHDVYLDGLIVDDIFYESTDSSYE